MRARVVEVETPGGPARAHVHRPVRAIGTLVLTHGAGGGIDASDLVAIRDGLTADGWCVVLVEMPWRVAGKKVASPPRTLDAAWGPVLAALTTGRGRLPGPVVVGGRSAGARVACRTAVEGGADAVLALSFPLVPPGKGPERSRADELLVPVRAGLPTHVVQGARDPFGSPDAVRAALAEGGVAQAEEMVTEAPGTHSFGKKPVEVVEAVRAFVTSMP